MKRILIVLLIIFSYGCSQTSHSTDWAFNLIVWQNHVYEITSDRVTNVGKEIGEVTQYSDHEDSFKDGNETFLNSAPQGTKLYEIIGEDTKVAIAFKHGENDYVKAVYHGEYGK